MKNSGVIAIIILLFTGGCDLFDVHVGPTTTTFTSSLNTDRRWITDFSDYPVAWEDRLNLEGGYRALPAPLDTNRHGFYLAGSNNSDNLFMFMKRSLDGFLPNATYRVSFKVTIATNVPSGCAGIGGAPGESVYVKAGAVPFEPKPVEKRVDTGRVIYRMNVDKGLQSNGGQHAKVLGNIANSRECEQERRYELKTLQTQQTIRVDANDRGKIWLFVGTDSAFEGRTSLFFTRIKLTATRIS